MKKKQTRPTGLAQQQGKNHFHSTPRHSGCYKEYRDGRGYSNERSCR